MKCFDVGILQTYIDGELSPEMMEKVMNHLERCEVCQIQFNELIEMSEWETTLKNEPPQPMTIDVQSAWDKVEDKINQKNIISINRGAFKDMSKMKKFTAVAAASLLVITGLPVVASGIYNLFSEQVLEDDIVNKGMTREDGTLVDATKDGVFHTLDEKITDQGITVHLTDLFVSESRVSVHYTIEDENGELIPVEYNTEGLDLKYDGMVEGKQVESPEYYIDRELGTFSTLQFLESEDAMAFELMKDGKPFEIGSRELGNKNDTTITFVGFNAIDYPVVLDINIDKIGTVEGSWNGQIEIQGNNK